MRLCVLSLKWSPSSHGGGWPGQGKATVDLCQGVVR